MRSVLRIATVAGASLLLAGTGCVMPDDVSRLHKDIADVQLRLRRVESDQAAALERVAALEARTAENDGSLSREEIADLQLQLEQLSRDSAVDHERMNELERRLQGFSQDLRQNREQPRRGPVTTRLIGSDQPPIEAGGASTAPPETVPDARALYNTAYADFSKGNYGLAIAGFEEYQDLFPRSDDADNALYWIGECHFSQGGFAEAIRAYDRLLERYPRSDKAAAGNLKKALAYLELNQVGQAIVQLRYVRSSFPDSDEARIARDKLTSLGAGPE